MAQLEFLEDTISSYIDEAIKERVFSGCFLAICQGKKSFFRNYGFVNWQDQRPVNDDTFFDLASLTKPLATSLVILSLIGQKKIGLTDRLGRLLDSEVPPDKEGITLFQLLNHCSGLAGHRPFYETLENIAGPERKSELLRLILGEPLQFSPGTRDVYSDLGFILLGLIAERQSGLALEEAVRRYIYQPLGLADKLIFNPKEKGIVNFAATEHCPWRQRLLEGEVDDQNTWIVGGVSGQAGLFGRGRDVLYMVRTLMEIACGTKNHPYLDKDLLLKAMSRQDEIKGSSWGLGFDTPSASGSSAGRFISPRSCGHLGFTGTSFWHDFDKDITVVLLTNRIHPSAANDKIKTFRPHIHDMVFQSLA